MTSTVFRPYTLPCGQVLKNRMVKAAMEENLANEKQHPGPALFNLYDAWAKGGVGLIITGNVMIDHLAMTGPGGVVLEKDSDIKPFEHWANIAKQDGCKVWMQINHPGRQVYKRMGGKVLSASNVALNLGKHSTLFGQPSAMSESEILDVIERFATTAKLAESAGFDGVEIHAAHGYLLAQFLSPLTNKRNDEWGGSIENRARLLCKVIEAVQAKCSDTFALAIKLNSADFQRGGFDIDDASKVIDMLANYQLDMIELSGGSYEAPAMQGKTADQRTLAREAYFLEFAEVIASQSSTPIMTTGGIKRLSVAESVIAKDIALAGMASALAYTPDLVHQWVSEPEKVGEIPAVAWKDKTLSGLANMALVKRQLRRLGAGKKVKPSASPIWSLLVDQIRTRKLTKRYRNLYQNEIN
ncbi:NADH:flavin oxidoreductase/NADH oxidase family protein [Glaciecola petra]|uniref:NADH:flavin oxidoreductase/NADH oxidase family protein n=1 Tax=Glaciecola petra TaxID=3075602 RepID=A0ABU2ZTR4_9ALTE|nr:NADH:flavin oxidoreductase/NADH oxidase family protein [Aestuariibacter sp. P117]MDT0596038.1 NADH:flavin oxidoreductase/NADH oxidase family protein [Aestuariibacter sp. P117]